MAATDVSLLLLPDAAAVCVAFHRAATQYVTAQPRLDGLHTSFGAVLAFVPRSLPTSLYDAADVRLNILLVSCDMPERAAIYNC